MYIQTCYPELINLSVCASVSYEEGVGAEFDEETEEFVDSGQNGIFALSCGNVFLPVPILTDEYIKHKTEGRFNETEISNILENAIFVINRLLIEPGRILISHYDILAGLVYMFPRLESVLDKFKTADDGMM